MRLFVCLHMVLLLLGVPPLAAQTPLANSASDEVVIPGTIPHCKALANDPEDSVVPPPAGQLVTMLPDPNGRRYQFVPNTKDGRPNVKASSNLWLRSSDNLAGFTFRMPKDGTPFCIGAKAHRSGIAKIMKIMDAQPFACRFLRFSLFVAARKAEGVIWLNGGYHGNKNAGAYTTYAGVAIPKGMSWTPVLLQVGPIDKEAGWVHLGLHLIKGDVWFVQPKFEIIDEAELSAARRKDEEICRSNRHTPFWQQREDSKL